jgi:hypothetical protein
MRAPDPVRIGLLLLWLVFMALSGASLLAEPLGDGFTRGLNRVTGFLGWQIAGAVLALALWLSSGTLEKGRPMRRICRIPGVWALVLGGLIAAWIAVAVIGSELHRRAVEPLSPRPPTAPVE